MLWYRVVTQRIKTPGGKALSYGLAVYRFRFCCVRKIMQIEDVSCDRGLVYRLAWDATIGQLETVHLYDVIIDRLP